MLGTECATHVSIADGANLVEVINMKKLATANMRLAFSAGVALMLTAAHNAMAAGISLSEMSAASVGNAHAGGAAGPEDAATLFFNPAGLTKLPGTQFTISITGIKPEAKFENQGSTSALGTPLTGGNGGDPGSWVGVPAIFLAGDINPNLKWGVGIHAPFGLKSEYEDGWVGRYHALKSELTTIDINPVLAFKLSDTIALAGGLDFQRGSAELTRAIDFGTICFAQLSASVGPVAGPGPCAALGVLPQQRDCAVKVDGNGWGYGYNLGALFDLGPSTRLGVTYRSKIKQDIDGNASYTIPVLPGPLAALGATPATTNSAAHASLELPDSVDLGFYAELSPQWSIMGDAIWTHWSRFQELRIRFDNGAADNVTQEQWRDATYVAFAVNYKPNDAWKLRLGVAYDPTPVKDEFRTARIPDNDRTWLSVGARYDLTKASSVDLGYAHLFLRDANIQETITGAGSLKGKYTSHADIVSVQFNQTF
jgi:long-chain fatty acid transport protein